MNPFIPGNDCFSALFLDREIAALFSTERTLAHVLDFEGALAAALGEAGLVAAETTKAARDRMGSFAPDMAAVQAAVLRDGLPVPELVRQLKSHVGPDLAEAVHKGSTSQDVIDTSLVLTLRDANEILAVRLVQLTRSLDVLMEDYSAAQIMGRTRMQAALPIATGERIKAWQAPLPGHTERLARIRPDLERIQFGGPVGDRRGFGGQGDRVARCVSKALGLGTAPGAWHATRDVLADYAGWLSLVSGSLGKMGQDISLMAQQGIDEIALDGGGQSSAMPHKQNPVLAETLVSFARFNAVQLAGMHEALIHEQERSGAAWTLEWMILPAMVLTTGRALGLAERLIGQVRRIGRPPSDG